MLATLSGVAGIVFARVILSGLSALGRGVLETWRPVSLDGRVLATTAGLTALTAVLFGIVPALQSGRVNIATALLASGGRGASRGGGHWPGRLLVVTEVAFSVVLLVTAGLLLRNFLQLRNQDPGVDTTNTLAVSVSLEDARYATRASVEQLFATGRARLEEVPGVVSSAASLGLPYQRVLNLGFAPVGDELPTDRRITTVSYATPGFFETLGLQLVSGRAIEQRDSPDASGVAVVNEAFARTYYPDLPMVGRFIQTAGAEREIVGVVSNSRQRRSWQGHGPIDQMPTVYIPLAQVSDEFLQLVYGWFTPSWVIRTSEPPSRLIPQIERALGSVDPLLPLASTQRMVDLRSDAVTQERFIAILVATLAGAAILLASLGIYGLVAGSVNERHRGNRHPHGARRLRLERSVGRHAARTATHRGRSHHRRRAFRRRGARVAVVPLGHQPRRSMDNRRRVADAGNRGRACQSHPRPPRRSPRSGGVVARRLGSIERPLHERRIDGTLGRRSEQRPSDPPAYLTYELVNTEIGFTVVVPDDLLRFDRERGPRDHAAFAGVAAARLEHHAHDELWFRLPFRCEVGGKHHRDFLTFLEGIPVSR